VRLAVISDTHLPRRTRRLPPRLIEACAAADVILHAGDLCTRDVLIELEAYGRVVAVLGNNDDAELARLLPVERVEELGGVRVGMVHDAGPANGRPARLARRFPGCSLVVYGHSHRPVIERHGAQLLLNPGSALERRSAPACTMAIAVIRDGEVAAELLELP
jgi:uncharacterized protein